MKVAGIDFSTLAVDLVLLDEDTPAATWHRFPLAGVTALEKARSLRARFPGRSWFEDQGVYLVGIEETFSGKHAGTAKKLGMVAGAIAALLPPELDVLELPAHEWKRETTGYPNSSKGEVEEWAADRGFQANVWMNRCEQDAFDAYAIAWAARAINQRAIDNERGAA